jgi:hypothetical protein
MDEATELVLLASNFGLRVTVFRAGLIFESSGTLNLGLWSTRS